jgi:SAM-dependent methyltransferase
MTKTVPPVLPSISAGSTERFGYEWHVYADLRPEYEEQFRRWTEPLKPEDWKDRTFLDVGCGMGRNSYWPMQYGAAGGLAIDVDERTLASARANLAAYPTVEVRKLSVYDITESGAFDIVFSIGVIHHLEFPETALAQMVGATKPGGRVLIWVYGIENNRWIVTILNPIRRAFFSRLPIGLVHHLALYPSAFLWAALRLGFGRIEYFRLLRGFKFSHLRSIVFDQMLPKIANYWAGDTVKKLMANAGLTNVELVWVNEMSWAALGTKPFA